MANLMRVMLVLALVVLGVQQSNAASERRLALVVGNSDYAAGGLPTAANDAGLVAQTLQAAGFDVVGARDLDGDSLRRTFRDFSDKVSSAGPDAVVMIYLAGHGLQFEGDNYFTGIDARIERDIDVPSNALKIADFLRPMAASRPRSFVVVLDLARDTPFAKTGHPLAGGLAVMEPAHGTIVAFNAAPGTLAPPDTGDYGVYARALAEMIREGGLPINVLLDRVRLRVNAETEGGSIPWNAGRVEGGFVFFERGPDAPMVEASAVVSERRLQRRIRDFDAAEDAYFAALERDTLGGYLEFLDAYPDSRFAKRVRAIVAARREAIMWRRTRLADTSSAYWTYLDYYPDGPHAWDARRRLEFLAVALDPPRGYTRFIYDDLAPPPEEEIVFVRRRYAFYFYDPVFAFAPPPPCPVFFLPPPLPRLYFPPPPPPMYAYMLPVPVYVPVAPFVRPVPTVVLPPNNLIAANIHARQEAFTGVPQAGPQPTHSGTGSAATVAAGVAAGAVLGAAVARVALPPAVSQKAVLLPPNAQKGAPKTPNVTAPVGAALPGMQGGVTLPKSDGAPKSVTAPVNPKGQDAPKGSAPSILTPQKGQLPTVTQPVVPHKTDVPPVLNAPATKTPPPPPKTTTINTDAAAAARRAEEAARQTREREAQAARAAAAAKAHAAEAAAAAKARAAEAAAAARARAAQQEQAARAAAQRNAASHAQQQQQQIQQRSQQGNAPPKKSERSDCGHPGQPPCR